MKHWRLNRSRIAVFLDDSWGIASTSDKCTSLSKTVKDDLLSAGFVPNGERSDRAPCQSIHWLRMIWHSDSGAIEISKRRVAKVVSTVCSIIDCEFVISARCLASFTGQIISTGPVVGNVSRIRTRHCSMPSACAPYWNAFDFVKSRFCFLDRKPHVFGFSDARATGCGAVISLDSQNVCHKHWDSSEASKSSTWRDFAAIDFAIGSFSSVLENPNLKWYTDSQAAAKIVDVGSMKPDLHKLAINVFGACLRSKIKLEIQWIPRTKNEKADFISRFIDVDDWQITESFFAIL